MGRISDDAYILSSSPGGSTGVKSAIFDCILFITVSGWMARYKIYDSTGVTNYLIYMYNKFCVTYGKKAATINIKVHVIGRL